MLNKIAYRYRSVLFALIMSSNTALIVSDIIIYLRSGVAYPLHQTVVKRISYWVADCIYRYFGYCACRE